MFNLSKQSQLPSASIEGDITGAFDELGNEYENPSEVEQSSGETIEAIGDDQKQELLEQAKNIPIWDYFLELESEFPYLVPDLEAVRTKSGMQRIEDSMNPGAIAALSQQLAEANVEATATLLGGAPDVELSKLNILNAARRARMERMRNLENQPGAVPIAAFNLNRHKTAQIENMGGPKFPVANSGEFIASFLDDLLLWNGEPGTQQYEMSRIAYEEVRNAVSSGFEEEANSILEQIVELDPITQRAEAEESLLKIYNVMLAPMAKSGEPQQNPEVQPMEQMEQMEPVMSENKPEGIVRYNLSDHILNNKTAGEGFVKTAADQFGQQYLLYGPTEKRVCPKLRGKNLSVGDIVSEYTCRHHCIDGIVIDDNKTICGEALWRANGMDKYSREYVNADGDIVGGYINKRFQVDRNVPEENKMRLKPGETRKPRPASHGNIEGRLQDMRNKEGQARNYGPNCDTSKGFDWCSDIDQNNVQQTQQERDRREEASGHQLVQYTNRDQAENNPKKAFNLKRVKTAELPHPFSIVPPVHQMGRQPNPRDKVQTILNPAAVPGAAKPADVDPRQQTFDNGKPMKRPNSKKKAFNLKSAKEYNPWAVCNKSTGGKSKSKDKFERCVHHIKDQNAEKESMSSNDIRDAGVKETHVQALLDRKHVTGKPEKVAESKKKT